MKNDIHPKFVKDAKVICATCSSVLLTGSTVQEMRIEVCSNCHPFYTGKQNLVDTAGRVDRFKRIMGQRVTSRVGKSAKKTAPTDKKDVTA